MGMKVIELRNYLLKEGARTEFTRIFAERLVAAQDDHGIHVLGHFEVVGEPDRFAFLRGFPDMAARLAALRAFYEGPFWLAQRDEVNALLLEWHDVQLWRPLAPLADVSAAPSLAVELFKTEPAALAGMVAVYEQRVRPALLAGGQQLFGHFVAELAPNDFPRLPVIQDPGLLAVLAADPLPRRLCAALEAAQTKTLLLRGTAD